MRVNNIHIRDWNRALDLKPETTQETYFVITNRWLNHTGGDLSREALLEFLNNKYSKNSVLTAFYAIKFFYSAANISLDVKRKDIAPTGYRRQRPSLKDDEVIKLINGSTANCGTVEKGYVCLSTVYGLRRIEIYNTLPSDIDIAEQELMVRPAKVKGEIRERVHLIPDEILPVMYDFKEGLKTITKKPSITVLNIFFDWLCQMSNVALRPRLGFHSIRRNLNSILLTSGLEKVIVENFLRWKQASSDMPAHYLTDEGIKKVDLAVFEKHPYLLHWAKTQEADGEEPFDDDDDTLDISTDAFLKDNKKKAGL